MKRFSRLVKTSLLVVFAPIITLLIGELLVRIILPQNKMVTWIEMHPDGFVMNQSGGTTFQEFGNRKAEYRFTKERLRGGEIKPEKLNILTIGDSFTFGLLLDEEDTYVHHLQQKVDQIFPDSIQFLNAAVGGSGLADWPGWLEEYGAQITPDYVLYFMNYDDVNRALSKNLYIYDETSSDTLIKSQRWQPRSYVKELSTKSWYRWLQANSEIANIVVKILWKNLYFEDLTGNFNPEKSFVPIPPTESFQDDSEYSNKLANAILDKIDYWCDSNGCEFIIINTGFFIKERMSVYDRNFYEGIQNDSLYIESNYFDNSTCVQEKAGLSLDEIRIPEDSHPNEKGAQIIADCTWEKQFLF